SCPRRTQALPTPRSRLNDRKRAFATESIGCRATRPPAPRLRPASSPFPTPRSLFPCPQSLEHHHSARRHLAVRQRQPHPLHPQLRTPRLRGAVQQQLGKSAVHRHHFHFPPPNPARARRARERLVPGLLCSDACRQVHVR